MDLKRLMNKGKKIVDERGGVESLKDDAEELKGIAKGRGSLTDKAKEAAAALKDPGEAGGQQGGAGRHQGGGKHQGGQQGQHQGGQGQHKGGQGQNRPPAR